MFQAAICEDEPDIARYIAKTLSQKFIEHGISMDFEFYSDGSHLLKMMELHYHYDVIFMDIEMPQIDGISICKKLRTINQEALVVFISNKEELVFSTFEVQPFRFIRKSHYDSLLPSLVSSLLEELLKRQPKILQIVEPGSKDLFSFDVNHILYVEAQGMRCCIHTTDGATLIKTRLSDIEHQLAPFPFVKPHRSYLVHCQYIAIIHKTDIELTDGSLVPIGRGHAEEVKKIYIQYVNRSTL